MVKSTVYWPNIHTEIENMVKSCTACQEMLPTKPSDPLIPHPIPISVWYTLGAVIFTLTKRFIYVLWTTTVSFPLLKNCLTTLHIP